MVNKDSSDTIVDSDDITDSKKLFQDAIRRTFDQGYSLGYHQGFVIGGMYEELIRNGTMKFGPPSGKIKAKLYKIQGILAMEEVEDRLPNVSSWDELLAGVPR
jgi:hypothetical protein